MRVLVTGGGTAGHVNPAIAIADTIKRYENDACIEFVSSRQPNDKATELVERAGYKLHRIDICGSRPVYDLRNIKTLYLLYKSSRQARRLIEDFKPDIVIGTGGYACYPLMSAGARMGIPTLVHESNAVVGKAIKALSPRMDCVLTNFESANDQVRSAKRIVTVGNPSIFDENKKTKPAALKKEGQKRRVLSFGGSGGSETFNDGMLRVFSALAHKLPDVEFYHATGKRDYERMKSELVRLGLDKRDNVVLTDYIYDMNEKMAEAELLICRAGAMTVSETALLGKAAVFVPSPYVVANHQYKNAKAIYDGGACELVEEKELASGRLEETVESLLADRDRTRKLAESIKAFGDPDANKKIYDEIKRLVEK